MKPLDILLTETRRIENDGLRQLFLNARTHNAWLDKPVPDNVLREIYDIVKFAPTSMNTQPMRLCSSALRLPSNASDRILHQQTLIRL